MAPHEDPLQPHTHDPNPKPPTGDSAFELFLPNGGLHTVTLERLASLPKTTLSDCYIVSTGHGTSGPFTFAGTRLIDLVLAYWDGAWSQVAVVSADGFGNRIYREEIDREGVDRPFILAYEKDKQPMTREAGNIRLIVPNETDDALRQVKWVGRVTIRE